MKTEHDAHALAIQLWGDDAWTAYALHAYGTPYYSAYGHRDDHSVGHPTIGGESWDEVCAKLLAIMPLRPAVAAHSCEPGWPVAGCDICAAPPTNDDPQAGGAKP